MIRVESRNYATKDFCTEKDFFCADSAENFLAFQPTFSIKSVPNLLLLSDLLGIFFSFKTSAVLRLGTINVEQDLVFIIFLIVVLFGLYLGDTYRPDSQLGGLRAPARILIVNSIIGCTTAILYYIGIWRTTSFTSGPDICLPSLGLFTGWAILTRLWSAAWIYTHIEQRHWLLLETSCPGEGGCRNTLLSQPDLGRFTTLTSQMDSSSQSTACEGLENLSIYLNQPWTGIIISEHTHLTDAQTRLLMEARLRGVQIMSPQDIHENYRFRIPADTLKDSWFLLSAGFNLYRNRVSWKLKRIFDLGITSLLMLFVAPIMLITAVAIKIDSPGAIFYNQIRSGLNGESFRVYKFRSMYQDAEKQGAQWACERDPRITRVGYWLRILRIDELPQIWNVLRGEMSLIGPRPERPEFDMQLTGAIPYYSLRYLVKPGITGWAQVMYPYGASVDDAYEKFAYDLYYIKNFSFWLDIAIVLKTIRVVLLGKGR
jgi:exopolysaccharide biosynthesis polyprenyl glycosylphosphotransferase